MKKLILLLIFCFPALVAFGEDTPNEIKIKVLETPKVTIENDSLTVEFKVEIPPELFKKESFHEFIIHLVQQDDYDNQTFFSNVQFKGNKRDRYMKRQYKKEGKNFETFWARKAKKRRDKVMTFSVSRPVQEWMYNPIYVYVYQTYSPKIGVESEHYGWEMYDPNRRGNSRGLYRFMYGYAGEIQYNPNY